MFLILTVLPRWTSSPPPSLSSMMRALRIMVSSLRMRPSTKACSCFASSYSAFSEMSPNSFAWRMRSLTSLRWTVFKSSSSASSLRKPSSVSRVSFSFIVSPSSLAGDGRLYAFRIQFLDARAEAQSLQHVEIVAFRDLVPTFAQQREQGRLHHVRAERPAAQFRRARDEPRHAADAQFAHVRGGEVVREHGLSAEIVRHFRGDKREAARHNGGARIVF